MHDFYISNQDWYIILSSLFKYDLHTGQAWEHEGATQSMGSLAKNNMKLRLDTIVQEVDIREQLKNLQGLLHLYKAQYKILNQSIHWVLRKLWPKFNGWTDRMVEWQGDSNIPPTLWVGV